MSEMTSTAEKAKKAKDSYETGRLFEEYVTKLFNEQNFKLKDWRKAERFEHNALPKNYSDPDLQMVFGRGQFKFAVECKWRRGFKDGMFMWGKKSKSLEAYKRYSKENNIPVFIVIGIGGESSRPEKMYVTPLESIHSTNDIYETDLMPFKRKPTHKFYYNVRQMRLF